MPRKITHPYTRETALLEADGKPVLICLTPPGYSIGFRPKHGRETFHLSMERAYELAQQETSQGPTPKPKAKIKPKEKPDLVPGVHANDLKKMRIQKSLAEAMTKLVDLVQKQVV